jgi:aminopeptidase C
MPEITLDTVSMKVLGLITYLVYKAGGVVEIDMKDYEKIMGIGIELSKSEKAGKITYKTQLVTKFGKN